MGGSGGAKRGGASGNGAGPSSGSNGSNASSSTVLAPLQQQQQQQETRLRSPPMQPQPSAPPAGTSADADVECQRRRATLLPIAFSEGKVTVGDGTVLLDSISPQARVPHPAPTTDMVVLSMAASKGATAMEDFALGQVW